MPIVDDPFEFGRIAATNAISDVYAMGGTLIMALALVGMPINVLSVETIGKIIKGGQSVATAAGIPIAGGHTIDSVEAIYGLVVMGLVHPSKVKKNADAKVGDVLILGKPIGVGVLSAAPQEREALARGLRRDDRQHHQTQQARRRARQHAGVHALTDITGFGLAGHTLELARGAKIRRHQGAKVPFIKGRPAAGANDRRVRCRNWRAMARMSRCRKACADRALLIRKRPGARPDPAIANDVISGVQPESGLKAPPWWRRMEANRAVGGGV